MNNSALGLDLKNRQMFIIISSTGLPFLKLIVRFKLTIDLVNIY